MSSVFVLCLVAEVAVIAFLLGYLYARNRLRKRSEEMLETVVLSMTTIINNYNSEMAATRTFLDEWRRG